MQHGVQCPVAWVLACQCVEEGIDYLVLLSVSEKWSSLSWQAFSVRELLEVSSKPLLEAPGRFVWAQGSRMGHDISDF